MKQDKKEKGLFRDKKARRSPPLQKTLKGRAKQSKAERVFKPALFITVIFLMLIALAIFALCYSFAPEHSLVASVSTVRGGFSLTYDLETVRASFLPADIREGDSLYMTQSGVPVSIPRDGIKMTVKEIDRESGDATLVFGVDDVPDFISTEDMINLLQEFESGTVINKVIVVGKVLGGRFVVHTVIPMT